MKKIILLLLASVVLGGCVSTPQERFPGFAQRGPQISQMAILVDGLMIDDIDGSIDGVNAEKHKTIVPQLANDVIAELEKLGYKAQLAHVNSGLFITKDAELVFSKDNQSTGVVVDKPVIAAESQPWTDAATRQFLRDAMLQSQARQAEPKPAAASSAANNDELAISQNKKPGAVSTLVVPKQLQNLTDDVLMIIQAHSSDVGMGKTIGSGVATALITGLLTGGLYVASMPVSTHSIDIAIIDLRSGETLWHNSQHKQGAGHGADGITFTTLKLINELPSRLVTTVTAGAATN